MQNTLRMNNNTVIPQMGIGCYLVPDTQECVDYLKNALDMGYRLIDTAFAYQNERSVGKGIRESGVPREEIFLTTKLWVQDYGFENAQRAIDGALKRLGTEYIDMMLLHRPAGDNAGAYKAMEKAYEAGKLRSIGVCNHTASQLESLMAQTNIIPCVDQMECHPLQQQKKLRGLLDKNDILLESWFPFGHGSKRLKFNETLRNIALKYEKSVGQIILRWHVQEGFVVIPKTMNPEHMRENLAAFDFRLQEEDMCLIRGVDENRNLGGDPESEEMFQKWLNTRFEY